MTNLCLVAALGGLAACDDVSPRWEPRQPEPLNPVVARSIHLGLRHACVITMTNRLVCWGDGAEIGLLDHPVSRVVEAATNRRSTAVTFTSGRSGLVTPWPSGQPEDSESGLLDNPYAATAYLYSSEAVSAVSPNGSRHGRISLGAEGGCRILPRGLGLPTCTPISWGAVRGDEPDEQNRYERSWVEQRHFLTSSTELAPGSSTVACARYREGVWFCDVAAMVQWVGFNTSTLPADRQESTHDFFTGYIQATGDRVIASSDVLSACVYPHGFCFAHEDGKIECNQVVAEFEGGQTHRAPIGRHFEPDTHMFFELPGTPASIACGSTWDSAVEPPPNSTATLVCAVDEFGAGMCDSSDGEPASVFAGVKLSAIATNGRTICAITFNGKVLCEQRFPEIDPALMNIPKGLRHD